MADMVYNMIKWYGLSRRLLQAHCAFWWFVDVPGLPTRLRKTFVPNLAGVLKGDKSPESLKLRNEDPPRRRIWCFWVRRY